MSKFSVGQRVFLFNSISMKVESDDVYAVLYVPVTVEGKDTGGSESIAERIEKGLMEVKEQYQLSSHQGVLDVDCLFASEEECREFFRKFFG